MLLSLLSVVESACTLPLVVFELHLFDLHIEPYCPGFLHLWHVAFFAGNSFLGCKGSALQKHNFLLDLTLNLQLEFPDFTVPPCLGISFFLVSTTYSSVGERVLALAVILPMFLDGCHEVMSSVLANSIPLPLVLIVNICTWCTHAHS